MHTGVATTPLLAPSTQPGGAFLFTDKERPPPSAVTGFAPPGWAKSWKGSSLRVVRSAAPFLEPVDAESGEAGKAGVRGRDYAADPEDGTLRNSIT